MVPGRQYTPRYALGLLRRRWVFVFVPFVLVGGAAALLARGLPDVYYSQATVTIVPQKIPESYVRSTVNVPFIERMRATIQDVKSPARLEKLIDEFDLYHNLRGRVPMEGLVAWMGRNIRIELLRADTLIVGFSGYDAAQVPKVAERLVAMFIERNLQERELLADSTTQFLDAELVTARQRLVEQERRVQAYRERFAGELPTQVGTNLQILQGAYTQLQAVMESLRQDRSRRGQLQEYVSKARASIAEPPLFPDVDEFGAIVPAPLDPDAEQDPPDPTKLPNGPAAKRLLAARVMLQQVLRRYTAEHPDVIRLRRIIEELEKDAAQRPRTDPKAKEVIDAVTTARIELVQTELKNLDGRIAEREAQETKLREAIVTYQQRVEAVPRRESEWAELTRDYNTLQRGYTELLEKNEASKLAANLERTRIGEQFRILEPPNRPTAPASPNRPQMILMGVMIGLGAGLAFVVLLEVLDTSFRSEHEVVTALRLPVLAMLPLIEGRRERRRVVRRRLLAAAVVLILVAGSVVWRSL